MAMELSPNARRIRIEEPMQFPQETENWSDPQFRHEVRTLKAQMRSMMLQQQETRAKHNLLLESTYSELKAVHERKVLVENQFQRVAERCHAHDQKFGQVEAGYASLLADMGLAKQAIDHCNAMGDVRLTELMDGFKVTRSEMERFMTGVTMKGSYLEDTYVPQALEAMQHKVEVRLKELRTQLGPKEP